MHWLHRHYVGAGGFFRSETRSCRACLAAAQQRPAPLDCPLLLITQRTATYVRSVSAIRPFCVKTGKMRPMAYSVLRAAYGVRRHFDWSPGSSRDGTEKSIRITNSLNSSVLLYPVFCVLFLVFFLKIRLELHILCIRERATERILDLCFWIKKARIREECRCEEWFLRDYC